MTESTIDFPKEGLCPEIWEQGLDSTGSNEVWKLTLTARSKIQQVANDLFPNATDIHIIGSITSNQYTENADIDVHFLVDRDVSDKEAKAINKKLQTKYSQKVLIGNHPIEVYFQKNKFQDMMSIGCYDFNRQHWIVGPEFKDREFNPYSEYYSEIKTKSEELATQIRNMIFSIYEIAIVLKKNIGTELQQSISEILRQKLSEVKSFYDKVRNSRKVYTAPRSKEEALKWRSSRKWKVADATFKLFDKYGYLAILRRFVEDYELFKNVNLDEEISTDILNTVKNYINNADKLSEQELYDSEQLDEGPVQNVALAALLAIPGILPAKTIQQSIDKNQTYQSVMADLNSNKKVRMVGEYTAQQAANIIARTLYAEARNDGKFVMTAVASVIYNRANGNKADFAKACLKTLQFSCWNKMTAQEKDPRNFQVKISKSVKGNQNNQKLWQQAMEIAAEMLAGKFKPITNANQYYNPDKADPEWKKQLTQVKRYGSHLFGYLKHHSKYI